MTYHHYDFDCYIEIQNASDFAIENLIDFCRSLAMKRRYERRSSKFWTDVSVKYYKGASPFNPLDLIHFTIADADSVMSLKEIEAQLRQECKSSYRRLVTDIVCVHRRKS